MNEDTRKLLLAIAANTREIPPGEFNMNTWKCGTVCCAAGSAVDKGLIPGLVLDKMAYSSNVNSYFILSLSTGVTNFCALSEALELPRQTVCWIFNAERYLDEDGEGYEPTTAEVAGRIEHIANGGESP